MRSHHCHSPAPCCAGGTRNHSEVMGGEHGMSHHACSSRGLGQPSGGQGLPGRAAPTLAVRWPWSGRAARHPQQLFQFPFWLILSLTGLCHPTGHPVPTSLHQPWVQRGPRLLQQQQNPQAERAQGPRLQPNSTAPRPCLQPPRTAPGLTQGRGQICLTHGVQTTPFPCHTPSQQETAPEALQRHVSVEADRPLSCSSPPLRAGEGTEPTHSAAPCAWSHSCPPRLLPARLMSLGFPFTLEHFRKLPGPRAARFWVRGGKGATSSPWAEFWEVPIPFIPEGAAS